MQGYNGTIFAYGQTGAGKTFTIQGPQLEVEQNEHDQISIQHQRGSKSKELEGIIQRSFQYIFQNIQAQQQLVQENSDGSELNYLIKCSYLEIYNEQIMDLLEPTSINLSVREDIKKGVYVEGLKEEIITSYRDMLQLTLRGFQNRHVGSTAMNRESSRSHSVLTTIIESKSLSKTGVWNMKTSRFHIIDLAGSERSKNTNAIGDRLKEAGMINKSLSALGNVINSLVERSEGKGRHIPYRDSKLTFILRDSLGGNSKTVIIANVSPSQANLGETLSTLEFAKRAKQIKNKAVVNEDSSGTILILKNEIKRLKKDLTEQFKRNEKLSVINQELQDRKPTEDIANFTCKNCRISVVMDEAEELAQDSILEDSLLIDDLNGADDSSVIMVNESTELNQTSKTAKDLRMSKEFKIGAAEQYKKMKQSLDQSVEKTKQAESLLALNLQNLTAQQRYFENELQAVQEKCTIQAQSIDAFTQQVNRDKMKLKLREDKIQKLETEHQIVMSEECQNLKAEIKLLQDQLEKEREETTNPKLAHLKTQLLESQSSLKKLQKDQANDQPNIQRVFAEQKNLIDDLTEYLKSKASLEAIESQEKKLLKLTKENEDFEANQANVQEQLNDLQRQYDILLEQNVKAEEVNQRITREYGKTNAEIKHYQEQIQKLTQQVDDLFVTKNQIEEQLQNEQSQTNVTVKELQLQLTEQMSSQNDLQSIFDSFRSESESKTRNLLSELDKIKIENKSLLVEVQSKQDLIDKQTKESSVFQDQIEKLKLEQSRILSKNKNELKQSSDQIAEREKEILNLVKENERIQSECLKLSSELDKSKTDSEKIQLDLNQNLNENKDKSQQLLIEIQNLKEQKDQVMKDHSLLLSDHEIVMKDQQALLLQYERLKLEKQALIERHNCDSKQYLEKQDQLSKQLALSSSQAIALTKAVSDKESDIQEQKEKFEALLKEKQEAYDKNIKQIQQIQEETLTTQINQMELKVSELREENLNCAQEKNKQLEVFQANNESQLEQIAILNTQVADLNDRLLSAKKQQDETQINLSAIQKELQVQKASCEQKQIEIDAVTEQRNGLRQLVDDLEKKNEETESQNKAYQSNISYLDVSVEQMQSTIQQKAQDYDRLTEQNLHQQQTIDQIQQHNQTLQEDLNATRKLLQEKCEITQGQDQENAEAQVLLVEANEVIQQKEKLITQLTNDLDAAQKKIAEKESCLQKIEIEKDNLQFKRDEATKSLEQKIRELKLINENLNQKVTQMEPLENVQILKDNIDCLVKEKEKFIEQLEQAKKQYSSQHESNINLLTKKFEDEQNQQSENLAQMCQEKEDMAQMLSESKLKESKLLQEVTEMQEFMDDLNQQLNRQKILAQEVDLIKQDCYKRITSIQDKQVACLQNPCENLENQKQKIKDCIAQALAEIADVSQYNSSQSGVNERQIEVSLLVSQIVCEFSKLYENQIVLEKKKASQDYKKYSDKCEKQKSEIRNLQEEKGKVNELIMRGKKKDEETEQLKTQIDKLKQEFSEQMALSMQSKVSEQKSIASEEILNQKISDLLDQNDQKQKYIDDYTEHVQQLQKQLHEQKQLYEVRVQSQEQEIEQHQYRYRELERKVQVDIQKQEGKFAQVQEQVHILAQSTKQLQVDKEQLLRQIQEHKGSVEQSQINDQMLRDQLNKLQQSNSLLQQQVQQRENEMAEVVQSLKQYAEANRQLEAQLNVLRTENEQLAGGHKNPNQKIQFHMKIKEENNRLRADNFRLQEDLQRKIETIYKQQQNLQLFESTTRTLKGAVSTTTDPKLDTKIQRDFNMLIQHITTCPQFAKLAKQNQVKIENSSPSTSIQSLMELISVVDDALELTQVSSKEKFLSPDQNQSSSQTRSNTLKGVPPRHVASTNLLNQSKSSQNLGASMSQAQLIQNGYSRSAMMSGIMGRGSSQQKNVPLASSSKKKLTTTGRKPSNTSSQAASSQLTMHGNHSQRQVLQPHVNNYIQNNTNPDHGLIQKNKRPTSSTNQIADLQNQMQESPVIINSYSSLYKQSQQQINNITSQSNQQTRIPPANSPFAQPTSGYEAQQMYVASQQTQNQQLQAQIIDGQYQQQQQIVPGANYSTINSKHKQYKQAQSQKSSQLGNQRSKSRQGLMVNSLQDNNQKVNYQNNDQFQGAYIE